MDREKRRNIEDVPTSTAKAYLQVGSYAPETSDGDAEITREYYRQGYIFKDEEAFLCYPERVCYVPELSDVAYTRQDFLDMCNGQEAFAAECFYSVDWQHPETWVEEQYLNDEWGWCADCRKIYDMEGEARPCPDCGREPPEPAPSVSADLESTRREMRDSQGGQEPPAAEVKEEPLR